MKKIFAVAALLILTGSTFAQTKWAAEDMGKLIQAPMDSVRMCLKGAYHEVNQFKEKTMIALTVILVILAATRKKPFWRFIFWMLAVLSIIL
jgi:nucleoside recognition membrane protein YjiH